MACLAEAQLQLGELEAAESSLKRAFEIVRETGEGWAEPEVHRIAAEAILRKPRGDALAAQRHFEEAVAIAQKQSSKWWELRATVGLARLLENRAVATRRARCWPKSTTGSPRASTPPI